MPSRKQGDVGALVLRALLETLRTTTPAVRWVVLALLAIYLGSGISVIGPEESGLHYRLGVLQSRVYEPGLVMALPAPFDRVVAHRTLEEKVVELDAWVPAGEKRRLAKLRIDRESTLSEETASGRDEEGAPTEDIPSLPQQTLHPIEDGYSLTGDANILQGRFALHYRIAEPIAYETMGERRLPLIEAAAYTAITHSLARSGVDRVLTKGQEQFRKNIMDEVQERFDQLGLGLRITSFQVIELAPAKAVIAAFEDVVNAQMAAKTLLENARAYRARTIPVVEGKASRIRRRADSYARETVASSEGEAAAFLALLAEYHHAPEILRSRLYHQTLQAVMEGANSGARIPAGASRPNILLEPSPEFLR